MEMKRSFDLLDPKKIGEIDLEEARELFESLNEDKLESHPLYQVVLELGKDHEYMDFQLFFDAMAKKLAEEESEEAIRVAWRIFDEERTGGITLRELERVARRVGAQCTAEELADMIERADSNNDGEVSYEDFYAVLTKRPG